jgi:hypothetical protein
MHPLQIDFQLVPKNYDHQGTQAISQETLPSLFDTHIEYFLHQGFLLILTFTVLGFERLQIITIPVRKPFHHKFFSLFICDHFYHK